MIGIIPTLAENISDIAVTVPGAIYTSWGNVYQLIAVIAVLGIWIGFGVGYHCYRLGMRFPWHRE